jgi:hypothetical protein
VKRVEEIADVAGPHTIERQNAGGVLAGYHGDTTDDAKPGLG